MTKKKLMVTLAAVLALSLGGGLIAGCGSRETKPAQSGADAQIRMEEQGGVISIKVNPEIAVFYDADGMVTKIEGRNDDGEKVVTDYEGFEGRECRLVIGELVARINEAGYFVEETEGEPHQITLEIEEGSVLPQDDFLNRIVMEIQKYTSAEQINTPVAVNGESAYGWTDYGDTDYGPDNDGITDYGDTDYGTSSDGVTDYVQTPADTSGNPAGNNSGNTDYGSESDGVTDYNDTDYGTNSDGVTDYGGGQTANPAPSTPQPAPSAPQPAPSGDSGYDGDSGYGGSGDSGYDDGNSGYGDSGDSGYDD